MVIIMINYKKKIVPDLLGQNNMSFQHLWHRRNRLRIVNDKDHAALSYEIFARLADRLSCIKLAPQRILNVSIAPVFSSLVLKGQYPNADIFSLDLSLPLLEQASKHPSTHACCAASWSLPIADNSMDVLVVHLSLMQIPFSDSLLNECQRVLKPGGQLMMSHLGLDTLKELRLAVQDSGVDIQINPLMDMHDLGDALSRTGFKYPVVDMECLCIHYPSAMELLYDIRVCSGWLSTFPPRPRMSKHQLELLINTYNQQFDEPGVKASFEVIYVHAVATDMPNIEQADGTVAVPLHVLQS